MRSGKWAPVEGRPAAGGEPAADLFLAVDVAVVAEEQELTRHERRDRRVGVAWVGPEVDQQQAGAGRCDVPEALQELPVVLGREQVDEVRHQHRIVAHREWVDQRVRADDVDPLGVWTGRDPGACDGERGFDLDQGGAEISVPGERGDEDEHAFHSRIGDRMHAEFTVPVALSVMVFFALCCQCASTLAVIRRETRSWRWPAFTFAYMTVLAYLGALVVYQVGSLF